MQKTNYFSGMQVKPDDLLTSQAFLEQRIDTNMSVIGNKGVVVGASTQDGTPLNTPYVWTDTESLGVYGLIAYDIYGRFIFVEPKFDDVTGVELPTVSNLTPDENGKLVVGGTTPFRINSSYLMVIRWDEEFDADSMRPSATTGILYPTRINPSFSLYLRDTESDLLQGDVVLATILTDAGGLVSANEDSRDTFGIMNSLLRANMSDSTASEALGNNLTFEDHINMVGSGQVSSTNPHGISAEDLGIDIAATGRHQFYLHSDGIKTDDISSTTSALFPSYFSSSLTSEEKVYIEALTEDNNEIVVVNGNTITPADLGNRYVLDMQNYVAEDYEGFYILAVSSESKSITMNGPYTSDTSEQFISVLSDRTYFPICSFYWGRPYYAFYTLVLQDVSTLNTYTIANIASTVTYTDVNNPGHPIAVSDLEIKQVEEGTGIITGSVITNINPVTGAFDPNATAQYYILSKTIQVDDTDRYDIDPLSFKDRRVFNNTGIRDIRREDLSAIRDSAPLSNSVATIYYARVESSVQLSYFAVGNKNLEMIIDGYSFAYTFVGVNDLSIDQLLTQLNSELSSQIPSTIKPYAFINHDKHLTIVAATSIEMGNGIANESLGFSPMIDSGEDVKCLIYTGEMPSIQEMYYDADDNLTEVYYLTAGNYLRTHTLTYTGDYISRVDETVEVM